MVGGKARDVIISAGNVCAGTAMGPQTTINDMACLYWQPSHANVSFRDIKAARLSNKCNKILPLDVFSSSIFFSPNEKFESQNIEWQNYPAGIYIFAPILNRKMKKTPLDKLVPPIVDDTASAGVYIYAKGQDVAQSIGHRSNSYR